MKGEKMPGSAKPHFGLRVVSYAANVKLHSPIKTFRLCIHVVPCFPAHLQRCASSDVSSKGFPMGASVYNITAGTTYRTVPQLALT